MIKSMSAEDYTRTYHKQPRSKYRNRRCRIDGHTFDSLMEGARYRDLKLMEQAGEIVELVVHPSFALRGRWGDVITTYEADFAYKRDGQRVVEDVKGVRTRVFNLKAKWMKADHGIDIQLITADMVDAVGMEYYEVGVEGVIETDAMPS